MKSCHWPVLALLATLSSCEPEADGPDHNLPDPEDVLFLVGNEGNYMWGNASVSVINHTKGEVTPDAFQAANDAPLGDVLHSMLLHDGKLFLVVNNSGKIEAVHPRTFQRIGTISGLTSPRFMLPLSETKVYVSDLYANAIAIINPKEMTVIGSIPLPGWTEQMALRDGRVYVANVQRNYLYVVNAATDEVADSLLLQKWVSGLAIDPLGRLWALSGGSEEDGLQSVLYRISLSPLAVEAAFTLGSPGASRLRMDAPGSQLYFLHGGVRRMNVSDAAPPSQPLIAAEGRLFHGLMVSDYGIHVTDAIDYVQIGKVYHYSHTAQLLSTHEAGRIPGAMLVVD